MFFAASCLTLLGFCAASGGLSQRYNLLAELDGLGNNNSIIYVLRAHWLT